MMLRNARISEIARYQSVATRLFRSIPSRKFHNIQDHSSCFQNLATTGPFAVGEGVPQLIAHPALWIHLMANFHVVRIMHDVLDHIFEHCVPGEHWVHLRAAILRLKRKKHHELKLYR